MLPYILFIYNSFINNIYLFINKICLLLYNGILYKYLYYYIYYILIDNILLLY